MKKMLIAAAALAVTVALAVPAMAETFTTQNGVLSIELPTEGWKEMKDPSKWVVLSDGRNEIEVEHLSNGEKLPEMAVASEHYANVYQTIFSTQNEVFIITGSIVDPKDTPAIFEAITSAKVLKYDTKLAVKKEEPTDIFTIVPADDVLYVVSSGLNVRAGYSTDDEVIDALPYGAEVYVTGVVQDNGMDYGWYRIDMDGVTGYVSSAFLSETAPETEAETEQDYLTGNMKTLYDKEGNAVDVFESTDHYWYDYEGNAYISTVGAEFTGPDGKTYTSTVPVTTAEPTDNVTEAFYLNGNAETLTEYTDGVFYNSSWVAFTPTGGGTWFGSDGTVLYTTAPILGRYNVGESHYLVQGQTGKVVKVTSQGGDFMDETGVLYSRLDDGSYMDYFGNIYAVRGE